MMVTCPNRKCNMDFNDHVSVVSKYDESEKHIIRCCFCKKQFVLQYKVEVEITQPDCLEDNIQFCEYDKTGHCNECGWYNYDFDEKHVAQSILETNELFEGREL